MRIKIPKKRKEKIIKDNKYGMISKNYHQKN